MTAVTCSCTRLRCRPASTSSTPGQRVDFGVVESRKGNQALAVKVLDAPASVAELRRRPAEELHGLIEDMIKVLEPKIMPDLRRDRFPDKKIAKTIAEVVHAVAASWRSSSSPSPEHESSSCRAELP